MLENIHEYCSLQNIKLVNIFCHTNFPLYSNKILMSKHLNISGIETFSHKKLLLEEIKMIKYRCIGKHFTKFLNKVCASHRPVHAWFHKINPVWIVDMCVCVCVSLPGAINN